jgi:hypothetical protein
VDRLPANPLVSRGLDIAQRHLGIAELSRLLGSPASTINAWRSGKSAMPRNKFLLLVDLLMQIDPKWKSL